MSETKEANSQQITTTEEIQQSPEIEETATNQRGIDVSKWQGKIEWNKVAKTGIKHVCMKMTEGASYVDPLFAQNWKGAKEVNISVNCYHYFIALGSTPEKQMENIIKNTKAVSFDPAKNILAIDVEEKGNEKATPVQMADNLNALLNLIKKDSVLSRRPVMIYTSSGYWDSKVKWDKYNFGAYPLWVAHWETQNPRLPKPWKDWAWWQYSSKGKVDGITEVDGNLSGAEALTALSFLTLGTLNHAKVHLKRIKTSPERVKKEKFIIQKIKTEDSPTTRPKQKK